MNFVGRKGRQRERLETAYVFADPPHTKGVDNFAGVDVVNLGADEGQLSVLPVHEELRHTKDDVPAQQNEYYASVESERMQP